MSGLEAAEAKLPCGHPAGCAVTSDEGTGYCGFCEALSRLDALAHRHDWVHPDDFAAAEARTARLTEALLDAREAIVNTARAGFDSTRGEIALAAIEALDAALSLSDGKGDGE